jgi:hypothetical protein
MINSLIETIFNLSASQIIGYTLIFLAVIAFLGNFIIDMTKEDIPETCGKCGDGNFTNMNNYTVPLKACDNCGDLSEACF